MQTKRILVIDDSEVVRETLALILGREFTVFKQSLGKDPLSLPETEEQVDLLILGVTPTFGGQASSLLRFAARAPFAILFLVDSKSTAKVIEDREQVGCLAKPFNPYELREKVGRLLAHRQALPKPALLSHEEKSQTSSPYLDFPYLSRTVASLVRRFAMTDLPILIAGEIGCGQGRVARAAGALRGSQVYRISVEDTQVTIQAPAHTRFGIPRHRHPAGATRALLIENVDELSAAGQSSLLNFLEDEIGYEKWRLLTTARIDLLEKVYQGQFLESLYYKVATLKLKLAPLADRKDDIPAIAAWFAQFYAQGLGLGRASLSPQANECLRNYLWFGNLSEMETVIARTLAVRRKSHLDASDLVFDSYGAGPGLGLPELDAAVPAEPPEKEAQLVDGRSKAFNGISGMTEGKNGRARSMDLNVLIHELAHELKNPMVTIKTFAQLLADRYQDENFRARFQDVVGGDIERMDELLEIMIEFAEFSQPRPTQVSLADRLRSVVGEISSECAKRQTVIRMGNADSRQIRIDEDQLTYALRNVLLAILLQTRMGSEIEVDIDSQGALVISYLRDAARIASVTHYFGLSSAAVEEDSLPLRMLLAKDLVERNGGKMIVDHSHSDRDILRMEFPTA